MGILDFFRLREAQASSQQNPERFFVLATLPEHIEPLDRGERYEDPLDAVLSPNRLGEVIGGGSQLTAKGEIAHVDIELELADVGKTLALVIATLEKAGAPVGSFLSFEESGVDRKVSFGKYEGLVVYLDGVGLPDEVYASSDINELTKQVEEALLPNDLAEIHASWAGPTETAFSLYGVSAERVFTAIEPILRAYPLCQNSRVVFRQPRTNGPQEIRLPMLA